ncbi:Tyrosine recombinase XerD [Anaerolineae bacterium]|nr:Tyrosine recombinase XerD [Anaerolineae bacterium]
MTTEISITQRATLEVVGQVANETAARHVFDDYRSTKATNTIKRQRDDLARFAAFLSVVGVIVGDLFNDPLAWRGITWGIVKAFVKWMLAEGDSIGSIGVRLSTVKTYAKLAAQAGAIDESEYTMIRGVSGYGYIEGKRIDERRETTRRGTKKAQPVTLTTQQANKMKAQPDTPQGRRDAVLMSVMIDLGLRVGEVAGLTVEGVNLENNTLTFYRDKVGKSQTHRMSDGLLNVMRAYMLNDAPTSGLLLRGSLEGRGLSGQGMNRQSIYKRVARLGSEVGVDGLSPHDLRHYWATRAANKPNAKLDKLMRAGGWSSPAMPMRYIIAGQIANDGLDDD